MIVLLDKKKDRREKKKGWKEKRKERERFMDVLLLSKGKMIQVILLMMIHFSIRRRVFRISFILINHKLRVIAFEGVTASIFHSLPLKLNFKI